MTDTPETDTPKDVQQYIPDEETAQWLRGLAGWDNSQGNSNRSNALTRIAETLASEPEETAQKAQPIKPPTPEEQQIIDSYQSVLGENNTLLNKSQAGSDIYESTEKHLQALAKTMYSEIKRIRPETQGSFTPPQDTAPTG